MFFAPWGEIILKSVVPMRFSILCLGFLGALPLFSARQQASGFHNESIKVKGRTRTYRLFVPSDLPNPVPLVFVFHGTETPGHGIDSIMKITHFDEIGQIHHALIIFPEAYEGNWNDGRLNNQARSYRDGIDDIAFVDAMLAQTERDYHVDRTRIDATGFSNGAIFCHYLAAHRSNIFAAIAPVGGPIAVPFSAWFHPGFPVSLLEIHGTNDPIVPYRGGGMTDDGGEVLGVEATAELWAKNDWCRRDYIEIPVPDRTVQDGCYPQCFEWSQGKDGTDVVLYRIIAGGHTWPGNPRGFLSSFFLGKVCLDFDASELIWKFFRAHPRMQRS
jgi:polyhydroxybutyrate depolymerase